MKDSLPHNLWVCSGFLILEINHLRLHNIAFSGSQGKMRAENNWIGKSPEQEAAPSEPNPRGGFMQGQENHPALPLELLFTQAAVRYGQAQPPAASRSCSFGTLGCKEMVSLSCCRQPSARGTSFSAPTPVSSN